MTQAVALSVVDPAGGVSPRVRHPQTPPLSELATANRQRDALYLLSEQLHQANSVDEVYSAAMEAIESALACDRSAILLVDAAGVMQFVASHGLSEGYRAAVTGHSPWRLDDAHATPVTIADVASADLGE